MRSLHVNTKQTILQLKSSAGESVKPTEFIWPKIETDNWPKAEIQFRNIILADFAKKCNVNISQLTQSEIRDIILGLETAEDTIQKR